MTTLQDALRELAVARKQHEIAKGSVREQEVILSALIEYVVLQAVKQQANALSVAVGAAEAKVRELALAEHALTGEYKPADGIQIKEFNKVVYEPEQARVWCVTYATKYLQLDTKAFEKAASVLRDLGAPVELTKEARAQIATDLDVWLLTEQQRKPVIE